jgi:hypothetical protein
MTDIPCKEVIELAVRVGELEKDNAAFFTPHKSPATSKRAYRLTLLNGTIFSLMCINEYE